MDISLQRMHFLRLEGEVASSDKALLAMTGCRLALTKEAQQNSIRFVSHYCRASAKLVLLISTGNFS
jgi:hypothetical protein